MKRIVRGIVLAEVIIFMLTNIISAGMVTIKVDTGATAAQYPISTGIPFPRGELTSLENLKLTISISEQEQPGPHIPPR
jgi:hypothetical protein